MAAVAQLVALQAQVPLNPYLELSSQLRDFRPEDLRTALQARIAVRIVAMQGIR